MKAQLFGRLTAHASTLLVATLLGAAAKGQDNAPSPIDLRTARIVTPDNLSGPESKAVELLVDEIAARTRLTLPIARSWPSDAETPVIAVGPAASIDRFAGQFAGRLGGGDRLAAEGFRIRTFLSADGPPVVLVVGNDARGVLFGIGKLLRSLEMSRDRISLRAPLEITTAPAMPIRGHQLGYRPKTNSYDAWDLAQWEQYIRDLAVFGCNAIELIPPRSDDDADSPHFPLPQMETMIGMSAIAEAYGLDVWIWYPAMELSYPTPAAVEAAVAEWGALLSKLPRVNALFVPSGDPGDAPPHEFMAMLSAQAAQLKRLHPEATMWISLQGYTQSQFDEMLAILREEPDWLAGVVHGPQTRVSFAKLRELVPARYPIRGYPDITHSMRCEYPVPDWDVAWALTAGREPINPRPMDESVIFNRYKDIAGGVITYSEGCNDDVNKAIWSALCWDPAAQPVETLRDYSRYFVGERYADEFAQGLLALELNWRGPLVGNAGVLTTLEQFAAMERAADPRTLRNWRFQQALYRAYYDAYQHRRLIEETAQEAEAMDILSRARSLGTLRSLDAAEGVLDRAMEPAESDALAVRVKELAEALFQSVGMQLSVPKYRAIAVDRGANLDNLDVPLNNRIWLKRRFDAIRRLDDETARLRDIDAIVHWTDPGPGGYYDDLGDPQRQPRLVRADDYAGDPGYLEWPTIGFHSQRSWRRSWCNHIDGLYQTPITMHYPDLDPQGRYKVRVVYGGETFDAKVRLVARVAENGSMREVEIHPFQLKAQPVSPVEFMIPESAIADGALTLVWQANADRGGPGRGCQIAEVWLVKDASEAPARPKGRSGVR
jgi:hypothetical protein